MTVIFRAECRDCCRVIERRTDNESKFVKTNGIRLRCKECGRTEFAEKVTDPQEL